jgi:hypothetical protein
MSDFNKWLLENVHVDLPRVMLGVFVLNDLEVKFFDHYLRFGFNPTFSPISDGDDMTTI